MKYLVTGGAGSLGRVLCRKLVERGHNVRCMDINECALASISYPLSKFTKIYGDVSDYSRVMKAIRGVDVVIHCAAMKNIEITETNATDCVRVNVSGTQNIAEAAMERNVRHAIFISSDKAVAPTTLYGATKQVGEHIWKAAGRIQNGTAFSIVRSGNFFESSGNVFEVWDKQKAQGKPLTITDADMARFFIEVEDLADIIIDIDRRNHTIIPIMKEYNIMDLMVLKYGEDQDFIITGLRQGEKMHEELMYSDEKTITVGNCYEVIE
jgi:UDP-N-acetylglucosamine 4,6-dehydratase